MIQYVDNLKILIGEPVQLTQRVIKMMLKDLTTMRKLGINPTEVCPRSYKAGLLVDASIDSHEFGKHAFVHVFRVVSLG